MNDDAAEIEIADMLTSLEEAIGTDAHWSSIPPPPDDPVVEILAFDPIDQLDVLDSSAEGEEVSPPARSVAPPPFAGISCELKAHADPPPRSAGVGVRVRGSARDVMERFRWGGT